MFFEKLRSLIAAEDKAGAFRHIYDTFDRQLLAGDYAGSDRMLVGVLREDLPINYLIGFLTITLPWKRHLHYRPALVEHVRALALKLGGPAKAEGVLHGLE